MKLSSSTFAQVSPAVSLFLCTVKAESGCRPLLLTLVFVQGWSSELFVDTDGRECVSVSLPLEMVAVSMATVFVVNRGLTVVFRVCFAALSICHSCHYHWRCLPCLYDTYTLFCHSYELLGVLLCIALMLHMTTSFVCV